MINLFLKETLILNEKLNKKKIYFSGSSDKNVHQMNITIKDSLKYYDININSLEYIVPTRN